MQNNCAGEGGTYGVHYVVRGTTAMHREHLPAEMMTALKYLLEDTPLKGLGIWPCAHVIEANLAYISRFGKQVQEQWHLANSLLHKLGMKSDSRADVSRPHGYAGGVSEDCR